MKGLIGKKIGMTQVYEEGVLVPVTVIEAGPCVVLGVKTMEKDSTAFRWDPISPRFILPAKASISPPSKDFGSL